MQYLRAGSVEEAVSALTGAGGIAKVLGGGTDLLVQMKSGRIAPDIIVDIKGLPGMRDIAAGPDGYRIGASVPAAAMAEHADLARTWPGVVEAASLIGSTQIQGRCTMAGNLCNASPAGDSVPALAAAGARVLIAGPDGRRDCAVEDVPAGPGKLTLMRGEFVEAILLPARPAGAADAYLRFIPRTEMDIAVASAGANLELGADGTVAAARVALGAVGPTVILCADAADAITGTALDDAALAALAAACSAAASPIDDKRGTVAFRKDVVGVLARRAAKIAYDRAKERM